LYILEWQDKANTKVHSMSTKIISSQYEHKDHKFQYEHKGHKFTV